jgi:hypothetical protein
MTLLAHKPIVLTCSQFVSRVRFSLILQDELSSQMGETLKFTMIVLLFYRNCTASIGYTDHCKHGDDRMARRYRAHV